LSSPSPFSFDTEMCTYKKYIVGNSVVVFISRKGSHPFFFPGKMFPLDDALFLLFDVPVKMAASLTQIILTGIRLESFK
jgi:hypothetical protein